MRRLLWRLRRRLRDPFGRRRYYYIVTNSTTEMDWMTGEGKTTDYTTGETTHFSAGPNPIGMPDWLVEVMKDDAK